MKLEFYGALNIWAIFEGNGRLKMFLSKSAAVVAFLRSPGSEYYEENVKRDKKLNQISWLRRKIQT